MIDAKTLEKFRGYYSEISDYVERFLTAELPYSDDPYEAEDEFREDLRDILGYNTEVYYGASRNVIVFNNEDWVIKIPRSMGDMHYNAREVENYNDAPEELKPFFAECAFLDKEMCVTIMRSVMCDGERVESIQRDSNNYGDDEYVDNDVSFDLYGNLDLWEELYQYICDREINDLHEENVGWLDPSDELPVMIDYSGY